MKKHEASGPDGIPIQFCKWLDEENLENLVSMLNNWWSSGTFPAAKLKAHTASIYKKGDSQNQETYRPISRLDFVFKTYASSYRPVSPTRLIVP